MTGEIQVNHRIPEELEAVKSALPAALMYLARGERAKHIPEGPTKGMRFTLSEKAASYIDQLTPEFGSRTQVITQALAWAAERDSREILMLSNTKI